MNENINENQNIEVNTTKTAWAEIVDKLLSLIKEREAEILRLRFGLDGEEQTLESIGQKMGITRERVRQIENNARRGVKTSKEFESIITPVKSKIIETLDKSGGVVARSRLAKALLLEEEIEKNRKFLEFLIDNFIDEVKDVKHEAFLEGYYLTDENLQLAAELIAETKKMVAERNDIIKEDELLAAMKKLPSYEKNKMKIEKVIGQDEKHFDDILLAYLELARDLDKTPFNQWGITDWRAIKPKRVNDKIKLILDWYKKPMHFREITDKINQAFKNDKPSHHATVHNDLISDDRFVLIGRGQYALKDWGYKEGTAADLAFEVLKEAGQPLNRAEIIARVQKLRTVKPNTVALALNNDARFEKMTGGLYKIK
jgi:DNA-directed RNA polymerase delta subunit/predicted DNA-binding protein (UPF0251 family)